MFKKVLVAVAAMGMMAVGVFADTTIVNGITWTYTVSDGRASIYKNGESAIPETTTGAITIPSSLGGYPVTSIGRSAFDGCSSLTSVTIPNSVTSIGDYAFQWCGGLTSVTIPDSVTSIGEGAFSYCSGLTSVTIPDSVTSIGFQAFLSCDDLTSFIVDSNNPNYKSVNGLLLSKDGKTLIAGINGDVVIIPNSVTSIENFAFYDCSGLTSVTIPNSVTSIGYQAFSYCYGLTSVTIPDSVTSIGWWAYSSCSGLTKFIVDSNNPNFKSVNGLLLSKDGKSLIAGVNGDVVIPQGVTSIGDKAFSGRSGLTSVTIPDSVTSIGWRAFSGCSGLTKFIVDSNNPNFKSVNGLLLSKDGKTLIAGVNGDVVIPQGVTSIGDWAFAWCRGLTSVTIPNSVTSIGYSAFYGCYDLKSAIFLGDAPRDVGDDIFDSCADDFTIKVKKGTMGWNGDYNSTALPATWQGYPIEYATESDLNLTYKVVFNANGGSGSMAAQTMTYNVASKLRANAFKRTGYTFQGWAKSKTGTVAYNDGASVKNLASSGTVTLFAVWKPNTYKVVFNANEGSGSMAAQTMTYNVASKLRANAFKRTGYTFQGWAKSKTGAVAYKNGASVKNLASSGTVTLFAVWKPNTYKVVFNANGGSGSMAAQTIACNTWTKLRANAFKRTGYTFQGWAKSKTGAVAYKNGASVKNLASSGTVTLFAVWKPNTYKIAFNANGGKGKMAATYMKYGKTAKLKKNTFKRTGYVFIGWAKSKKGAVAYKNTASVKNLRSSGTITLYAVWAKKNYKVAFYANGGKGKMSAQTFTYGKATKLKKNAFKRSGYTFIGWAKSASLAKKGTVSYKNTQAIKNLTTKGSTIKLYAVWAKTKYKVAFYANGGKGKMSAQTFTYGKAAKLKKNAFKRTGYAFKGWAKSSALAKKGTVSYKNTQAIKNLVKNGKTVKLYAVWKRK